MDNKKHLRHDINGGKDLEDLLKGSSDQENHLRLLNNLISIDPLFCNMTSIMTAGPFMRLTFGETIAGSTRFRTAIVMCAEDMKKLGEAILANCAAGEQEKKTAAQELGAAAMGNPHSCC